MSKSSMNHYKIEVGEDNQPSVCHCCDNESNTGHGFIYKNDDAYAVYYAGWSASHPDKVVSLAIAIGEWDDNSTTDDRTCLGIEAYENLNSIDFRVINPNESPWPSTDLLGEMFDRDQALSNKNLDDFYNIAELIVRNHDGIRDYLNIESSYH